MVTKDASLTILDTAEIKVAPTAHIMAINWPFLVTCNVVRQVLGLYGVLPYITSAADFDPHRALPYHSKGYAWDFRSREVADPDAARAYIESDLQIVDKRFRVLYHDSGSGMHFHVEYQFDKTPA